MREVQRSIRDAQAVLICLPQQVRCHRGGQHDQCDVEEKARRTWMPRRDQKSDQEKDAEKAECEADNEGDIVIPREERPSLIDNCRVRLQAVVQVVRSELDRKSTRLN